MIVTRYIAQRCKSSKRLAEIPHQTTHLLIDTESIRCYTDPHCEFDGPAWALVCGGDPARDLASVAVNLEVPRVWLDRHPANRGDRPADSRLPGLPLPVRGSAPVASRRAA